LANAMRAIYYCLDNLSDVVSHQVNLFSRLAVALTDRYQRLQSKKARYRPKQTEKKKKKIKPPRVRQIEEKERERLQKMNFVFST